VVGLEIGRTVAHAILTTLIFFVITTLGVFVVSPNPIIQQIALIILANVISFFVLSMVFIFVKNPQQGPKTMLHLYMYLILIIVCIAVGVYLGYLIWGE